MKTIRDERTLEVEFESCGKAYVAIRKDYERKAWVCWIDIIKGDDILIEMNDVVFSEESYPFDTTSTDEIVCTIKLILKAFD